MQISRKHTQWLGAFFILVMLSWYIGYALLSPVLEDPNYITNLTANRSIISIGVLFELVQIALVLGIAVLAFPIIKYYKSSLGFAYISYRVFESIMLLVAAMCPLILISLSEEFHNSGAVERLEFSTMGYLLLELRNHWSVYVLAFFHPLAALILYFVLYKLKLVPNFISLWGLLAAFLLLIDQVIFESFGLGIGRISGNPITGIPMGLNEIVLGLWLVFKGLRTPGQSDAST